MPADISHFISEILAVIVLYKPPASGSPTLLSLSDSIDLAGLKLSLFVYDNSPVKSAIGSFNDKFSIEYFHNPANPGVAEAYNSGAEAARMLGKKWVLLLDQDTLFPEVALSRYAAAVAENQDIHLFAPRLISQGLLCSPCGYRCGMGYHLREVAPGIMGLNGRSLLNSGVLVSLDAFDVLSGFDERIPLDFADHDFCRRFEKRFNDVCIIDLDCEHGFSDREERSLDSALARFEFFCRGARFSTRSNFDLITHLIGVLIRCIVLSIRYRSFKFAPAVLREFISPP